MAAIRDLYAVETPTLASVDSGDVIPSRGCFGSASTQPYGVRLRSGTNIYLLRPLSPYKARTDRGDAVDLDWQGESGRGLGSGDL
jgi:hypothetical protein